VCVFRCILHMAASMNNVGDLDCGCVLLMFDASGVFVELTECRRRYLKTNRKCRMI